MVINSILYFTRANKTSFIDKKVTSKTTARTARTTQRTASTTKLLSPFKPTITVTTRQTTTRDSSCDANLCENNSTCIPSKKKSRLRSYLCDCKIGFSGNFCEKDLRPCSNYVCIHNSTCESPIDNPMEFKCVCQPSFEGLFCESNIVCKNVTCSNGGNCIADYSNFSCNCPTYFNGIFCEDKDSDLIVLETVSASISVVGIIAITSWCLFILLMDLSRYVFKMEPGDLSKQREVLKKNIILRRIKARVHRLVQRYNRLEFESQRFKQKKTKFQRDFSHFSISNIRYIDEDDDDDASTHLELEKLRLINGQT
jgi:hypothetical protein